MGRDQKTRANRASLVARPAVAGPAEAVVRFPVARPVAVGPAVAAARFPAARPVVVVLAGVAARSPAAPPAGADPAAEGVACPVWVAAGGRDRPTLRVDTAESRPA